VIQEILTADATTSMSNDRAGLGPPPYTNADPKWPTIGYDSSLEYITADTLDWQEPRYTRAEWLALAVEMEARWRAWGEWCQTAHDSLFLPPKPENTP
jgi:hypothetical protein